MLDGLLIMWVRLVEPEEALDFFVCPEAVRDTAHESESGRSRSGLSFGDDFFYESFVFCRFPVVQRWILHDLSACEPDEGLWAQQTA